MAREQFDQSVVAEFERELRDALAIEPSPDFGRQVRARIAARRTPPMRWTYGLAAAAVCVIGLGLGWWLSSGDVAPAPVQQTRHRDVLLDRERPVSAAVATVERSSEAPPATHARVRARPEPGTIAEAEVIVPPDGALALARFLELARTGALNEEMLKPLAAAPAAPVLEIEPLVVAPITVPEIETATAAPDGGTDRE
jgi:hypothetical protein